MPKHLLHTILIVTIVYCLLLVPGLWREYRSAETKLEMVCFCTTFTAWLLAIAVATYLSFTL